MWYCFRVEPQREMAVKQILRRCGFRAEVPTETKWKRQNRYQKRRPVEYPKLVGYVLVEFEKEPPWYWLFHELRCVKSVVGMGGQPTPISSTCIGKLGRAMTDTRKSFAVGQRARIADGSFEGYEGRVEAIRGEKARMVLEFLGSVREIEIAVDVLEAA